MKRLKRLWALVLAMGLIISGLSFDGYSVKADDNKMAKISVESLYAKPGTNIVVKVLIEDNPGILGAVLKVSFDNSKMTLTKAENGEAFSPLVFTAPGKYSDNNTFSWDGQELSDDDVMDGEILKLTFAIPEDAEIDDDYNISISYDASDIVDYDLNVVNTTVENGGVRILNYIPGDLTDDGKINSMDVISLRRYIVGNYEQNIIEYAGNVNGDLRWNSTDVICLRRYIAGGYGIKLLPHPKAHPHALEKIDAVDATSTTNGNIEYWYCRECDKCYKDAYGAQEISIEDTVIPIIVLDDDEYQIEYHITNHDEYLESISIYNPNPDTYKSEKGLKLSNISVRGYVFDGWYDGEGANGELVKSIPVGATGKIDLYARWHLVEYNINFDSPDVPMASKTYTVNKGATLEAAKWYGYTFVGWSNDDGFIVSRIKPGTTGNITLHANWTSNRNRGVANPSYGEPLSIIEDNENGRFEFVYDIGRIENVPLKQIEYIGNSDGIQIDNTYSVENSILSEDAREIANVISKATTRSSGWTLSEEWNKVYEAGSEIGETKGKSAVRTDSEGRTVGGNYFVSNSQGGSSYISTESGGSSSNSSKVTTDRSMGLNTEYSSSTEKYVDTKLGVKNETEVNAGVKFPVDIFEVSAGVKNTTTVNAEVSSGRRDKESFGIGTSSSFGIGTANESSSSSHFNVTQNQSSNWNSTESYEKSYSSTTNTSLTNSVSEEISKKTTYNVAESTGGENKQEIRDETYDSNSDTYSTAFRYSQGDKTTTERNIKFTSNEAGYYRLVNAGTVHVFGVVGYDIATNSYYTYSYSVLDDERHTYLDYSKDNAKFDDCENAIIPFEIPYKVNEYVNMLTTKSDDLEIGLENGKVNAYSRSSEADTTVIIPQYFSADNGADNTKTAIKVTSLNKNAFRYNTNIKKIVLPVYIDEIPDNAFEGCTNLEEVVALGVTSIGNEAFKGCISLKKFAVDNKVVQLGDNAFEGVDKIEVAASNEEVFNAALNSGAKSISLDMSSLDARKIDNKTIEISNDKNYIALLSNGVKYNNLSIKSEAKETYISNMTFENNKTTPLVIDSEKLTLNRVNIFDAPGFAMICENENTDVKLYGAVSVNSKTDIAILTKSLILSKENVSITGTLNTVGDVLVCGNVTNDALLNVVDNKNNTYEIITEEEWNRYRTSKTVSFDLNGGEGNNPEDITVYYGQRYGTLPEPVRNNYTFEGWFDEKTGGTEINQNTIAQDPVPSVLYAHWSLNQYEVMFNPNGGNVSTTEITVDSGALIGSLPTPTRNDCIFIGWFTSDGIKITENTLYDFDCDITLKAHWQSEWVLDSALPQDATQTNQKWTYDLTSKTTSSSSTMSGWTQYNSTWEWGPWGEWSPWSRTQYYPSDSRQVEKRTVTDRAAYTNYKYYIYRTSDGYGYGTQNYYTGSAHGYCTKYDEINITYALSCVNSSLGLYGYYDSGMFSHSYDNQWFYSGSTYVAAVTHDEWRYRDRSKVWTYYFKKTEQKESETEIVANGDSITNVNKWVKYIVE
jgi:uncharacterized repeat protein (TIGR02543 family)